MTTTISGTAGVTFPAGGVGNPAAPVGGTSNGGGGGVAGVVIVEEFY